MPKQEPQQSQYAPQPDPNAQYGPAPQPQNTPYERNQLISNLSRRESLMLELKIG